MKNPCKRDCPGRSSTCHSKCEKYLAYYEHNHKRYREQAKQRDVLQYIKEQVELGKRK